MRYRILITFLFAGALMTAESRCFAGVLYTFNGNITPYYFLPGGAQESFSYLAPGLITQDTVVSASDLSSSYVGYPATCQDIEFLLSSPGWGVSPPPVVQIAFIDGVVNPNYYFPLDAFDTPGTYDTVNALDANTGTLVVTQGVPEPSSIAMLPVGIGFVLAYLARRKKNRPGARGLAGR